MITASLAKKTRRTVERSIPSDDLCHLKTSLMFISCSTRRPWATPNRKASRIQREVCWSRVGWSTLCRIPHRPRTLNNRTVFPRAPHVLRFSPRTKIHQTDVIHNTCPPSCKKYQQLHVLQTRYAHKYNHTYPVRPVMEHIIILLRSMHAKYTIFALTRDFTACTPKTIRDDNARPESCRSRPVGSLRSATTDTPIPAKQPSIVN